VTILSSIWLVSTSLNQTLEIGFHPMQNYKIIAEPLPCINPVTEQLIYDSPLKF